jgi:hypothetical protein
MLELHDADAEAICGGRHHGNGYARSSGGSLGIIGPSTSVNTSISNTIIFAPQFNLAVNIAGFNSSIVNGQGNVLSLGLA